MRDASQVDQFTVQGQGLRKTKPRALEFNGVCPFCIGEMRYVWHRNVVTAGADPAVVGQGGVELPVVVHCTCELEHDGRPLGEQGCGQRWTMVIEL